MVFDYEVKHDSTTTRVGKIIVSNSLNSDREAIDKLTKFFDQVFD